MAFLSDITAGTVSISAGGTALTGVGTSWQVAQLAEGDMFIADGWNAIVDTVNSNTSITLKPLGIRGAALSGAPYILRYMSDGSRVSAQARQAIDMLGNGSLQALAPLAQTPNTMPYFIGPGSAALMALTAHGRALIGGANGAATYGTLGTIPNAQLPGRLGTSGAAIPSDNYNLAVEDGYYSGSGSLSVNGPPGNAIYGPLHVLRRSGGVITQTASYIVGSICEIYARGSGDGGATWNAWRSLLDTFAVTSAGQYYRFTSGLQICTILNVNVGPCNTPGAAGLYESAGVQFNFPASFASSLTVGAVVDRGSSYMWGVYTPLASSYCMVRLFSPYSSPSDRSVSIFAVGAYTP